jgi:hypothetical protein
VERSAIDRSGHIPPRARVRNGSEVPPRKIPWNLPFIIRIFYLSSKLDIGERRKEMASAAPAGTGTMHIEAVREDASPSRTGLAEGYMKIEYAMKIECAQCWRPMTSTTTGWK